MERYVNSRYFDAIKTHDHKKLKQIVKWYPRIIKSKNTLGLTGLMQAVASRNYDAITYLLNKGIDPNVMDQDGWTAKAWAVLLNDFESMKRLRGLSVLSHSLHNDVSGLAIVAIGV
ncbi:MAG: ankyrin repeat domain-containing protein [Sulfuricurvum sp.]|nr:ankyrin repeat domain-containing protein [Sulfuricurvum sp.]